MTAGRAIVRLEGASFGFGGRTVVPPVDLTVFRGDRVGIVGPNGCGKTTLMRGILRIVPPRTGRVVHEGRPVFGYVPQRDAIDWVFPFPAEDVVSMALLRAIPPIGRRNIRAAARRALAAVGIEDLASRPYRDLSGGQKQRVLIARALALKPDVLALDEPTSGMDLGAARQVLDLLRDLVRNRGLTVLMVSHDLQLVANETATVLLFGSDGRITAGPVGQVISSSALSGIYRVPVRVVETGGHRAILPGDAP